MTVIVRKIASIPHRPAVDTWSTICELISKKGSSARGELTSISGIACALLASEAMSSAIVISGVGARVRIYCLYGDDATAGDDSNESSLPHDPTDGDWSMSLPCPTEDLDWVRSSLKKRSTHITVRDMSETTGESVEQEPSGAAGADALVDLEKFLNL